MTERRTNLRDLWPGALALGLVTLTACPDVSVWDRKDAHAYCRSAIDERPWAPPLTCGAIHLCINEAQLDEDERERLLAHLEDFPGCAEP